MTKKQLQDIAKVQEVYNNVYEREWNASRGKSPIRIVGTEYENGTEVKTVFENEGNFYLCGFTWLWFSGKGNAGLKPALKKLGYRVDKEYGGGLSFRLNHLKLDQYGDNGDYLIRENAYKAAALYLRDLGFKVYAHGRLD